VFRGGGRTFEKSQAMEPAEDTSRRLVGGDGRVKVDRKGKGRDFVEGSIDCVCMLDDSHFVSGGDSGFGSSSAVLR